MNETDQRRQAKRLAQAVVEKLGTGDAARNRFQREMGKAEFSTIGSGEGARIWTEAIPPPPQPAPKVWHRPSGSDAHDREQVVRSLVEFGLGPATLASSVLRLIDEADWPTERAIEWGWKKMRSSNRYQEPWIAEAHKIVSSRDRGVRESSGHNRARAGSFG
jgi:hypothetical protein